MRSSHRSAIAFATLAAALAGCGGSSSNAGHPSATHPRPSAHPAPPTKLTAAALGSLPAAVQDAAVATLPDGRIVLLGGLDSSGGSTGTITLLSGGIAQPGGALPAPQHDAQAARLGADVFVFGGGVVASYNHILRYDPASRSVSLAGALPSDASDVAVTPIANTAYIVGGYTGAEPLDTVIAWTPGSPARVVGRLPTGLRYAAVAAVGRSLIIAGGTEPQAISDEILSFDTATGALKRLGTLPYPLTHASAASLDGRVLIVGGKHQLTGGQTGAILAIDPATGAVTRVGQLPQPLSDAAVAQVGGRVLVAGGDNGSGPQRGVIALTAAG